MINNWSVGPSAVSQTAAPLHIFHTPTPPLLLLVGTTSRPPNRAPFCTHICSVTKKKKKPTQDVLMVKPPKHRSDRCSDFSWKAATCWGPLTVSTRNNTFKSSIKQKRSQKAPRSPAHPWSASSGSRTPPSPPRWLAAAPNTWRIVGRVGRVEARHQLRRCCCSPSCQKAQNRPNTQPPPRVKPTPTTMNFTKYLEYLMTQCRLVFYYLTLSYDYCLHFSKWSVCVDNYILVVFNWNKLIEATWQKAQ